MEKVRTRENLIRIVLRLVGSERDDPHAYFDAELEYCHDMLLEAAREFVEAHDG